MVGIKKNTVFLMVALWGISFGESEVSAQEESSPAITRVRPEVLAQRRQQIAQERAAGRLGLLEAEFLTLACSPDCGEPAHRETMRAWLEQKGSALKAEREARRTAKSSARLAMKEELQAQQRRNRDQAVVEGRIGRMEAEFLTLLQEEYSTPEARNQALQVWQVEKGQTLQVERETRQTSKETSRQAMKAEALTRKQEELAQNIATSRIGPREAELQALVLQQSSSSSIDRSAIQAWLRLHGSELQAEREARRAQPTN